MRKVVIGLVVLAIAGIGIYLWKFRGSSSDTPATPAVTQGSGAATGGPSTSPTSPASAGDAKPATIAVRVTDAAGPIANANVRLAPDREDGADERELVAITTDKDGRATVELAAGAWSIAASAPGHEASGVEQTLAPGERVDLVLQLVAGGKLLGGIITDASGGPVAGARIDASKLGANDRETAAIAMAVSGADGKYQITVPAGQLYIAASHADYAPQARYVDVGDGGATADFALVPGGVIEGIVLDEATRTPVAARVFAQRDGGGGIALVESGFRTISAGADGKFRIAGLRPGAYELGANAVAAGMSSRAPTRIGLGVAEQLADVQLLVAKMPAIRGKVIGDDDKPVAGANVMAFSPNGQDDAKSAADGTFALTGLPPGRWMLMARGDDQLPEGTTPVELVDQDVTGVVVRTRGAARVTGRVEPPQACEVRLDLDRSALQNGSMPMLVRPTRSAPDGTFVMTPVSPGKATIAARCDGGDEGAVSVDVTAGGPEIVVKVAPGASIAGRVTDGQGKPVPNATVMATATAGTEHVVVVNGRFASGVQGMTDAKGDYLVKGLTAGPYRLAVLDRGRPMKLRGAAGAKVTVAAAEAKTGVDLGVELPDGKITGTVTTADGKPLADAWVSVHQDLRAMIDEMAPDGPRERGESRMTTIESHGDDEGTAASAIAPVLTDASGKFAITGLARGTYEVIAEAQQGKLRGRVAKVTPDANITIAALGLATLSGKVTPPGGVFTVELDGPTHAMRSFAAPDGTFELGRVDPGDYTIAVSGKAGNGTAKVTVAPNTPASVTVALVANAIIVGKVVDAEGKPAGGFGVALVEDTGGDGVQLRLEGPPPSTGPDGTFRIEAPAGKKVLLVMTPPRPTIKRGITLVAGQTFDAGTITIGADQGTPPPPKP